MHVYDMLLQPVLRRVLGGSALSSGLECWDLRSDSGMLIAPGIYYYRMLSDGKAYFGKMTVQ
jgi:hypothetical protein